MTINCSNERRTHPFLMLQKIGNSLCKSNNQGFLKKHKSDISGICTELTLKGFKGFSKKNLPPVGNELTTLTPTGLEVCCFSNSANQSCLASLRLSDPRLSDPYKVLLY